jgi:hypothetical protein
MRLITQRVVQPGSSPYRRTGINAFCYLHVGQNWLDEPPNDLGLGELVNQIIEVDPPVGNRVRSYLDIIAPDSTHSRHIVAAIQAGTDLLADSHHELPWNVSHGEIRFSFNVEAALAVHWQVELRILLGYALSVRQVRPDAETGGSILSDTGLQP